MTGIAERGLPNSAGTLAKGVTVANPIRRRDGGASASEASGAWRSRIVGHGVEAPDQLLANPHNWRIHPQVQQEALAGVLSEVGWVQDIIVNERTGHVIDGHLRVSLALRRNEPSVPVVYVDLLPEEEALVLATLDPLAAMAVADKQQLDALLRDVTASDEAVQAMLTNLASPATAHQWDGMPDFDQQQQPSYHVIMVHFADEAAIERFAAALGQVVTKASKYIWYPPKPDERTGHLRYVERS